MKSQSAIIKQMVLDKAAAFLSRRGLKGWNTADLAKSCGLAKNTLYKIIGSKEKLLETLVIEQIDATIGLLNTIIAEEAEYRAAARRMMREGPDFLSQRPRVTFPEIFLEYPGIADKALRHRKAAAAAIIDFIEAGQRQGHIRDDIEPAFLFDLVQGIIEHSTRSGLEGEQLRKSLAQAFICLQEGVRAGNW